MKVNELINTQWSCNHYFIVPSKIYKKKNLLILFTVKHAYFFSCQKQIPSFMKFIIS